MDDDEDLDGLYERSTPPRVLRPFMCWICPAIKPGEQVTHAISVKLNRRLPDLANVFFGAAIAISVGTVAEQIARAPSPQGSANHILLIVVAICSVLSVGMWALYTWLTLAFLEHTLMRMRDDLFVVIMMFPLICVLAYAKAGFVLLMDEVPTAQNHPSVSPESASMWALVALAAFFFFLCFAGAAIQWFEPMPKELRDSIRRRNQFSAWVCSGCILAAGVVYALDTVANFRLCPHL